MNAHITEKVAVDFQYRPVYKNKNKGNIIYSQYIFRNNILRYYCMQINIRFAVHASTQQPYSVATVQSNCIIQI